MSTNLADLLYLIPIVTFILALRFLSNPAHARRGNQIGAAGMLVAIAVTWVKAGGGSWWAVTPQGRLVGLVSGWPNGPRGSVATIAAGRAGCATQAP